MKVFVTGVCGQLGHDVMNELSQRGYIGIGSDIQNEYSGIKDDTRAVEMPYVQLDITNKDRVNDVISEINPDVIIHCAAWTAVDDAEDIEKQELVKSINVNGTKFIANVAKKIDSKMVYISTDYVFDGKGNKPWNPDCKDFAPLNFYGKTKLDGELAVSSILDKYFIVRIAWVFGVNGSNFIKTMIKLSEKYNELRVVDDQIGTPTYTIDLAKLLVDMIETEKYGYYHATNEGGYISWADFAKEIFRQKNIDVIINKVSTIEYGNSKAKRPLNSRLDKTKLVENGFDLLPNWKDALHRYLKNFT